MQHMQTCAFSEAFPHMAQDGRCAAFLLPDHDNQIHTKQAAFKHSQTKWKMRCTDIS
jgi:hypothetical protein